MTTHWKLLELHARLLPVADREAILGDIAEAEMPFAAALSSLMGLILRRQLDCWRSWRPWIVAAGILLSIYMLLVGESVSVALLVARNAGHAAFAAATLPTLQLITISWATGYATASLSRRTLWITFVLALIPCFCCFAVFRVPGLSHFCIFSFFIPAIAGAVTAMRGHRLPRWTTLALALPNASLLLPNTHFKLVMYLLLIAALWPCWYLIQRAFATPYNLEGNVTT